MFFGKYLKNIANYTTMWRGGGGGGGGFRIKTNNKSVIKTNYKVRRLTNRQ